MLVMKARRLSASRHDPAWRSAIRSASRTKRPEFSVHDALHLSRWRGSIHRHVGRDLERNGFEVHEVEGWREHYAPHLQALARSASIAARRPGRRAGGRRGEDAALAPLPCRPARRLRAQQRAALPDPALAVQPRPLGPACSSAGGISIAAGCSALPSAIAVPKRSKNSDSPFSPLAGRVPPSAERAERSEAGVRGRCRKSAFPDAAPSSSPPPCICTGTILCDG